MNHVFVTGGTGFIGTNLLLELLKRDLHITALCRSKESINIDDNRINWVLGSVTDYDSLLRVIPNSVDVVFHLAGSTTQWKKKFVEQFEVNVNGTKNMLKASEEKGIKRFIHLSSIAAFGVPSDTITEESVSNASTSNQYYSYTKWLGEEEVKKATREKKIEGVIINPAHVIGPYDSNNWITLLKFTYNDDLPLIPPGVGKFCHVKDIAKAMITAAEKGRPGENYLLGGHKASFLELINTACEVMGKDKVYNRSHSPFLFQLLELFYRITGVFSNEEPKLTKDKLILLTKKIVSDDSKARKELDFDPVPIRQQIKDTYDWLKAEKMLD